MRHNARTIAEAGGFAAFANRLGLSEARLHTKLDAIEADVQRLPANAADVALDEALAWTAVRIAVARHAGTSEIVQTVHGPVTMQRGKDLTAVKTVIGTGGPLAHGATPASVLTAALADPAAPFSLRPTEPMLYIDADYLLYASGLLVRPRSRRRVGTRARFLATTCRKGMPHEHRTQIAQRSRRLLAARDRRRYLRRSCARRTSRAGRPARSSTFDAAVARHKACRNTSSSPTSFARPRSAGKCLTQPRGGFGTLELQIELMTELDKVGLADIVPTTTDSYTRNEQWDKAQGGVEESRKAGRSMLNGFPDGQLRPDRNGQAHRRHRQAGDRALRHVVSAIDRRGRLRRRLHGLPRLRPRLHRLLHQGDLARRGHPQLPVSRPPRGALSRARRRAAPTPAGLPHRHQHPALRSPSSPASSTRCWPPTRACATTASNSARPCTWCRTPPPSACAACSCRNISSASVSWTCSRRHVAALDGRLAARRVPVGRR